MSLKRYHADGSPRCIRCYDNGGETCDRYTVVFVGRAANVDGDWPYVGMSERPFHPQGFGQHGASKGAWACDRDERGNLPRIGESNHLGKRITFAELPADCKKLVLSDYRAIWGE